MLTSVDGVRTGGTDALRAVILYAVYGAGSLAMTARWRRLGPGYLGLALVASAPLWVLWWQSAAHHVGPAWGAVVAIEALVMAAVAAVLQRYAAGAWYDPWKMVAEEPFATSRPRSHGLSLADLYRIPLVHLGEAGAMLAATLTVWTAWRDAASIAASPTPVPIVAGASLTAVYFLLAWLYRSSARTWAASLIGLAGTVHALNFNYYQCDGHLSPQFTIAFLGHATLAVSAALCLDRLRSAGRVVRRAIGGPLADSAIVSSLLAVPAIVFGRSAGSLWLACCFPWLAAVWLVFAWRNRAVVWFAAHQAALAFAAVAATTVWLRHLGWITPSQLPHAPNLLERMASVSHAVLDPRNLQAWGIALGLLSLVWVVARIVSLHRGVNEKRLLQGRSSVDWCVRHGLVTMQWLLAAYCTLAEVGHELVGGAVASAAVPSAFGPTAWILLAVLAVMLIATLWERWTAAELVAVLLAAATLPCLIAGRWATQLATASALRWGLGVAFVALAAVVCQRARLRSWCERLHAGRDMGPHGSRLARAVLLATTAIPVVVITLWAAELKLSGTLPAGPAPGSFFAGIGASLSYLIPLTLVIVALVGLAVRESSAGYAFSAGLVLEMAVTLGYMLHAGTWGIQQTVLLLQLAAITASAWAIVWLVARRWLDVWREPQRTPHAPRERIPHAPREGLRQAERETERHAERDEYDFVGRRLMNVQLAMGILGNGLLMAPALLSIILLPAGSQDWPLREGLWPGWVALALLVAAAVIRQVQTRGRFTPQAAGLVGMTSLALLACTVLSLVTWAPEWGYRTLMLAWAMYAVVVVAATWWVASLRTLPGAEGPPQFLIRAASTWVVAAGLAATLLGLKAAFFHDDPQDRLWGAAAIALASTAGAAMAVWRRREGWALAASPGVNLAASLVVWFVQRSQPFDLWWMPLLEANVIAAAAVALVWLAARKRLYLLRDLSVRTSPLLALQTALAPLGGAVLVTLPVLCLLGEPDRLPRWATDLAAAPGWTAILLAAVAAAWYLRQVSPRGLVHVPGSLALALGVLAACAAGMEKGDSPHLYAAPFGPFRQMGTVPFCRPWLSYHVLTAAWAAAGLAVLGIGWAGRKLRMTGQVDPREKGDVPRTPESVNVSVFTQPILASRSIDSWVTLIGALTVALALCYAAADPAAPWWSFGALATVGATLGLLAIWRRRPGLVYVSGLLGNIAATVVWVAWWRWDPVRLAEINVVAFSAAALAWSLVRPLIPKGIPELERDGRCVSFVAWAARAGLVLLGLLVASLLVCDLLEIAHPAIGRLGGICLGASLLSIVACSWDRTSRFVLAGLYGWVLTAAGLGLAAWALKPDPLCWTAGLALALFVLTMAIAGKLLARDRTRHAPRDADPHAEREEYVGEREEYVEPGRFATSWFPRVQMVLAAWATPLAAWVAIDGRFNGLTLPGVSWPAGRMAGALGALALLAAGILMPGRSDEKTRGLWQYFALGLGMLLLATTGWAWLVAEIPAPWLHRCVILMASAVLMALVAGPGLARILPSAGDWIARGRRAAPWFGGLATAMLAVVLLLEAYHRQMDETGFMTLPAVIAVGLALAALLAALVSMAVAPRFDPLKLSDRQRTAYVYAAEVVLALVGLHLWLTEPQLFQWGIIPRYWMFLVLALAFAGAGLAEWFQRRRLPVLSGPLERTAVLLPIGPAAGFWFVGDRTSVLHLAGASPLVWFLGAVFYGALAARRRSLGYGLLAAAAANVGLGVLWQRCDWGLLEHPQLWLIPWGLTILASEFINHKRLGASLSAGLRYLGLSLIYIPSSTEFLRDMGGSVYLPLVLVVLSLLGILTGIVLRIRSFLFLGLSFLLVVIVTMIKYAAVDQQHTWVFFVACIILGAIVIGSVAFYEKRRNDLAAMMKNLKQWQR